MKLKGGLLPFPRTACALYAKRSYHIASELRPVPPRDLTRTVDKHVCQPGCRPRWRRAQTEAALLRALPRSQNSCGGREDPLRGLCRDLLFAAKIMLYVSTAKGRAFKTKCFETE